MVSSLEHRTDSITGMDPDPESSTKIILSVYTTAFLIGIGKRVFQDSLGPLTNNGLKYLPTLAGGIIGSQMYQDNETKCGSNGFINAGFGTAISQAAGYYLADFLIR